MCVKLFKQKPEVLVLSKEGAKGMVANILDNNQEMFQYQVSKHKDAYHVVRIDGTTVHVRPVYAIKTEYLTEAERYELDMVLTD